jgi:hypothetical protein
MEITPLARPTAAIAPDLSNRPASAPVREAAPTILPQAATVVQTPDTAAIAYQLSEDAQRRASREQALRDIIERHLTIDPATRTIVSRAVNTQTGEVVSQFPDDAILRLRSYFKTMKSRENGSRTSYTIERSA